jgi:hypothetical protein
MIQGTKRHKPGMPSTRTTRREEKSGSVNGTEGTYFLVAFFISFGAMTNVMLTASPASSP